MKQVTWKTCDRDIEKHTRWRTRMKSLHGRNENNITSTTRQVHNNDQHASKQANKKTNTQRNKNKL